MNEMLQNLAGMPGAIDGFSDLIELHSHMYDFCLSEQNLLYNSNRTDVIL